MPSKDIAITVADVVATMSPDAVRRALLAQPHVADTFDGSGPLAAYFDVRSAPATRARLSTHFAHLASRRVTVQMLDPLSFQLLRVVSTVGGRLSTDELLRETEPLLPWKRDELVDGLVDRLLVARVSGADGADGGIVAVDGLDNILARDGRSVQWMLLDQRTTKDDIANMLRANGVVPPTAKHDRIDALGHLLSDRAHVLRMREQLDTPSRNLFDELLQCGAGGERASALGIDPWHFQVLSRMPSGHIPEAIRALMELDDTGLIWFEPGADRIGTWVEVIRAVFGRLHLEWPLPSEIEPKPIMGTGEGELPSVLSAAHGLLERVAAEPITGLKTGGIGVKVVRDIAKRSGQSEPAIDLLLRLALSAGIIRHEEQIIGRGRNASWVNRYAADRTQLAAHTSSPPSIQWMLFVDEWIAAHDETEARFNHAIVRYQLLRDLIALEPGTGIPANEFVEWANNHHWLTMHIDLSRLQADLRTLGMVPSGGPIGLTTFGRVLLGDPAALAGMLPAPDTTFVVQADHTIVAPPTLAPVVRSMLERLASVQSSGSATVYRLDPAKIGAHLADGNSAESIVEFLTEASIVPIPPTVARLLVDLERQRSGLTVREASTVVTADDVVGLAAAVKVRAAALTLLAPTVAVSSLAPSKVIAALRAKGLAPSIERGIVTMSTVAQPAQPGLRATSSNRRPRPPLIAGTGRIDQIVEAVGDAPGRQSSAAVAAKARGRR